MLSKNLSFVVFNISKYCVMGNVVSSDAIFLFLNIALCHIACTFTPKIPTFNPGSYKSTMVTRISIALFSLQGKSDFGPRVLHVVQLSR